MQINAILIPERIYANVPLKSKKKCIEYIAHKAANTYPGLIEEEIYSALIARERLGSTTLDYGIALPHARLPRLQEPFGLFIRLREGILFDEPNSKKIDLIFALFVPEEIDKTHLQLLSHIAEKLKSAVIRHEVRQATNPNIIYEQLCS